MLPNYTLKSRLAIGYGWYPPFFWTEAHDNAVNMKSPTGWDMRWFRGSGDCSARRHIHVCEQAIDWQADYICYVGADQVHPENMFQQLIHRIDQGHDAVAALVPTRMSVEGRPAFQKCAWRLEDGKTILINPNDADMQKIDFIGSGVLMFAVKHLLRMREPWFDHKFIDEKRNHDNTTDTLFVHRLGKEAGIQVWVDTTIEVGHIHSFSIDKSWGG